jgi:hypothetical protein
LSRDIRSRHDPQEAPIRSKGIPGHVDSHRGLGARHACEYRAARSSALHRRSRELFAATPSRAAAIDTILLSPNASAARNLSCREETLNPDRTHLCRSSQPDWKFNPVMCVRHTRVHSSARRALGDCRPTWKGRPYSNGTDFTLGEGGARSLDRSKSNLGRFACFAHQQVGKDLGQGMTPKVLCERKGHGCVPSDKEGTR